MCPANTFDSPTPQKSSYPMAGNDNLLCPLRKFVESTEQWTQFDAPLEIVISLCLKGVNNAYNDVLH